MNHRSGPGVLDVVVVILSPFIATVLTAIYLVGWWAMAAYRRVRGEGADR